MGQIRHITFFKALHGVDRSAIEQAVTLLSELSGVDEGQIEWIVKLSLDERNGLIIVVNSLFDSPDSQLRFRQNAQHIEAGKFMAGISSWQNGDYEEGP